MTCVAYLPAMRGGFIWDDDAHVTRPELRSAHGLNRIWFDLGATQQYYPLLHSAFWLEQRLWGDDPLGYHLVNVLLHCGVVCLVYAVLRRLEVPGALLAAAIFAVHPVEVESVAWITEQKNTLSALFYLGAMLVYLRFDEGRKASSYWLAIGLFVLGLATKTVTATLPAALLVIFWWQRGRLSWRKDVRPLLPFFAVGAAAGVFTAWVERKLIGAEGAEFELSFVERGLIAGRVIWFYLGKLIWPSGINFHLSALVYRSGRVVAMAFPGGGPRDAGRACARQLAVACAAGRVAVFRRHAVSRARLSERVSVHLFVRRRSLSVSGQLGDDRAVCVGCHAGGGAAAERARWVGNAAGCLLVAVLASLTWRQSGMYGDLDTLYQTTIDRNPNCWMAYNNLGVHVAKDQLDDAAAMALYRRALEIKPTFADAHYNLANALVRAGDRPEAIREFNQALQLRPAFADAENNLGNLLKSMGEAQEAVGHLTRAADLARRCGDPQQSGHSAGGGR